MNDMYDDLEITMLNDIKSLISMISCPDNTSESKFMLSRHIRGLEDELVTHMSYRICGKNNIKNQLSYLKSEEDRLYNAMRSYTNLSDMYDEVDKRELIYRYNAIRTAIIECKTTIEKQDLQKQYEEQEKQEKEKEKHKAFIFTLLSMAGLGILCLITTLIIICCNYR